MLVAEQSAEAQISSHTAMVASHSSSSSTVSGMGLLHTPHVGFLGNSSRSNHHFSHGQGYFSSRSFSDGSNASNASYGIGKFSHNKFNGQHFSGGHFCFSYAHKSFFVPECQICGKRGHTAANCNHRHVNGNFKPSRYVVECQICESVGMGLWTVFTYPTMHIKGKDHLLSC